MGNQISEPRMGEDAFSSKGAMRHLEHKMPTSHGAFVANLSGDDAGEATTSETLPRGTYQGGQQCRPQTIGGVRNENADAPPWLFDVRDRLMQEVSGFIQSVTELRAGANLLNGANRASELIQHLETTRNIILQTREGQEYQQEHWAGIQRLRPQDTSDLLALNLSLQLSNPRNQCFANTVLRCWAWLPVYAPLATIACWGTTKAAMENILSEHGPVDVTRIPELEAMWAWYPPDEPSDVADFLYSLWRIAESDWLAASWWQQQQDGRPLRKESMPVDIPYPHEGHAHETLQNLVNAWSNVSYGQHFKAGQAAMVLQIGRYSIGSGTWKRHNLPLEVENTLQVAVSWDGVEAYTETYRVAAMILHQGSGNLRGHFTTVLYYQDIGWVVDDGESPKPFDDLTDEQKGNIFQIWLVQEELVNFESRCKMDRPTNEDKQTPPTKRQKQEALECAVLNVTQYGKEIDKWLMAQPRRPIFLLETHLEGEALKMKTQYLATRGWKTMALPAAPTGQGGNHGGMVMVHPPNNQLFYLGSHMFEGCGWMAMQWDLIGHSVVLIGIYAKCGEDLQGVTNRQIWASITAFVRHLQLPYILMGDMNISPEEMAASNLLAHMEGAILATGKETTLHGAELDCSIVSKRIAAITQVHGDWEVPCRPHCQLVIKYFQTTLEKEHPQLMKYPAIPKLVAPSWKWDQCKFPVRNIDFMGKEIGQQELCYAEWAQQAEEYVLQHMEQPQKGRGRIVNIQNKPLVDPIKPWTWKRGAMAFWGQWVSILSSFQKSSYQDSSRRKRLEQLQWVMHKHWQGKEDISVFEQFFYSFMRSYDDDEYFLLYQHSLQQEKQAKDVVLNEETEHYKEWLQQGYTKGLKSLYKVLKRDEAPYLRPFQSVSVEERQVLRLKQWKEIWNCQDHELHLPMLEDICSKGRTRARKLPPLQAGHMQKLARRLPQKASGIDGISNDLLRNLPFEGFEALAQMLMTYEQEGVIPQQWQANLVVLIPKSEQIERPIALVSTVYRLWCKMRADELRQWQAGLDVQMPWERARPGCQVLHIALKRLLQAEVMTANKRFVVSVLCDLSNFYDRISLSKLTERWQQVRYPEVHAMFATQLYTSARYLEDENITQGPLYATNGILAGDPQAPQVAKVFLHRSMQIFQQRFPEAKADLWIDDISFDIVADDPKTAANKAYRAYHFLKETLQEDDLPLSIGKTGFLVNHRETKAELKKMLTEQDPAIVDAMRDLGCDSSGGRLRRIRVHKQRLRKGRKKQTKLMSLKISRTSTRIRLHKGSIQAGSQWGIEAMGEAPHHRRASSLALARCIGLQKSGSTDIVFDMNREHQDPADLAKIKQVRAFHQLLRMWPENQRAMLLSAWKITHERLEQAKHRWKIVYGPMAALQAYLREMKWHHEDMEVWIRPGDAFGEALEIRLEWPWHVVQKILQEACMRDRWQRIKNYTFCEEFTGHTDWTVSHKMQKEWRGMWASALKTWHQGSLLTHGESQQYKKCPYCDTLATPVHLIWLCKWTNKRAKPIPEEWLMEINEGASLELWSRGILQSYNLQVETGMESLQAWGSWQRGPCAIPQHEHVTIVIKATNKDPRMRHYLVGVVHHGENERKGAISVVLPGEQTVLRAWVCGLLL